MYFIYKQIKILTVNLSQILNQFENKVREMIKFNSSSQHSQRQQSLSSRLVQIKHLLTSILSQKNASKYKNLEDLARRYVQNGQSKFNKKIQLQKQNMIMSYQLSLLVNLFSKIEINANNELYIENKNSFDTEIKLKEINRDLERKIKGYEIQIKQLKQIQNQINKEKQKDQKKLKIYEKKIEEFQKLGGSNKIYELKENLNKTNDKNEFLNEQNEKLRTEIKKLSNKCKILSELNTETENKVASIIVKQNINRNQNKDNKNNQGNQKLNFENKSSNHKVQLLAAKQEIRELKNKIQQMERLKQAQKIKYEEKQTIYQKMVMKKIRN